MRSLVALAAVLVGCVQGDFTERAGQREAVALAWHAVGGAGDAPAIGWREAECSTPTDEGGRLLGFLERGQCASGAHFTAPEYVNLVWPGDWRSSALAHELMHAALYRRTGDDDAGHMRPEWAVANDVALLLP